MGFGGAGFAFLLSLLGALENMAETIYWVEDGIDDWLKGYGAGKYEDVLAEAEKSETMHKFLNAFTVDLVVYSLASSLHSMMLIASGFIGAFWIIYKTAYYSRTESGGTTMA